MAAVKIVTPSEYRASRLDLLAKEKELTKARDALAKERRSLPIVEVTKPYTFTRLNADGVEETVTLSDLFEGRRQLAIYHFMLDPPSEPGCSMCSAVGDSIAPVEHLHNRSTSLVVVSRAPIDKITAYKKRMGWKFPWVSSAGSDFNYDFRATQDESVKPVEYNFASKEELDKKGQTFFTKGEQPGSSCFVRGGDGIGVEGKVYHTYSAYSRGDDKYNFSRKDEY